MKHRIGLVYVPGALPCFEAFGNLPTDLVKQDGLVEGKPASEVLDMIIIPGGSLVESQTIKGGVAREIISMADSGKFVLGICSGFQILSKGTDIGRLSPTPIEKEGFGLLDAQFKPLICTDRVKAAITGRSFLTDQIGAEVAGFHCHTYGDITLGKQAKPILISHVERLNYREHPKDLVSGTCNSRGNVVGVLTHALLDQNPIIIEGIAKSLGMSESELSQVRRGNARLQKVMKDEIGVSTSVRPKIFHPQKKIRARTLLITALESGGGKTFISTGLAGVLRKRGFRVGLLKVGGDVRDLVPALYLTKEPMREYSSISVCDCGWTSASDAVTRASKDYDFILIEGAMNIFTGMFFDQVGRPASSAEVAAALGTPTIIVAGCDKEGIEGGVVNGLSYAHLLKELGVKVAGVILNRVCVGYMTDAVSLSVKQEFADAGVELLGIVPVVDIEGRGTIPEVEIRYEDFGAKALETAEKSMDLDKITAAAAPTKITQLDYEKLVERFKKQVVKDFKLE